MSETTKPYDPWEAYQAYQAAGAAAEPKPDHDKPWVKIGIRVLNPLTGQIYTRVGWAGSPEVATSGSDDRWEQAEADALWDYLTNPVRCDDLTPSKNED